MENEEANDTAVRLAVQTYIRAKELGVEEMFALQLAQQSMQHWLFALQKIDPVNEVLKTGLFKGD